MQSFGETLESEKSPFRGLVWLAVGGLCAAFWTITGYGLIGLLAR